MVSYMLLLSLIEYKTLVLREDMEAAQQLLPSIPKVCFPLPADLLWLVCFDLAFAAAACLASVITHCNMYIHGQMCLRA